MNKPIEHKGYTITAGRIGTQGEYAATGEKIDPATGDTIGRRFHSGRQGGQGAKARAVKIVTDAIDKAGAA